MIIFYRIALYLFLPVVLVRLLYRAAQSNRYFQRIPQRFGFQLGIAGGAVEDGDAEWPGHHYWIHAVSVGEVNAAVPLVRYLETTFPDSRITVTTMTPTGSDRVMKTFGSAVSHCYLPYDYPGAVKRFLDEVKPDLAMVMETEIWPNYINGCSKRGIPIIYTNVRMSEKSFKGYSRFKSLFGPVLKKVDHFAVQSRADADRLVKLGASAETVHVTGSIKFDIELPASVLEAAQSVRRSLGWDRPVWIAGSTHEGEESQVLDAFIDAQGKCPELLLVLVPRHPERFPAVFRLCNRYGCKTVLRSQQSHHLGEDTEVYIADTMGELALLIAASDIAFIGGSMVAVGGHNILEACAAGITVLFGPHMFNFQEISDQVLANGAGVQVLDSEELASVVVKLVNDPVMRDQYGSSGKKFVEENRGALAKICELIVLYTGTRENNRDSAAKLEG